MEPNPLAIYLLCVAGAGGLVFLFWLNHRLRVRPKREATAKKAPGPSVIGRAAHFAVSYIMGGAGPVNDYGDAGAAVMSRGQSSASEIHPSSLQTRHQTGADQTEDPKVRRVKLLDTYRALRKLGMSRDDARALLNPWGIPLDNNLWADAAPPPPEEPQTITPIAGRPTSAQFSDPDLAYHPPPR